MASLREIRAALASQIEAGVPSVTAKALTSSKLISPAAVIGFPPIDYRQVMSAGPHAVQLTFPVQILVAVATDQSAAETMCDLIDWTGSSSIPLAIEADPTLGSVVHQAVIAKNGGQDLEVLTIGNVPYLGYQLLVSIIP